MTSIGGAGEWGALVKKHLMGQNDQPGMRQYIAKSNGERAHAQELHAFLVERVEDILQVAAALATSAEVTTNEAFNASMSAGRVHEIALTAFNSENAASLRQATRGCKETAEKLAQTNLKAMQNYAEKLGPLLTACAGMKDIAPPVAPESDYNAVGAAIGKAHQEMQSYEQNLG